MYYIAARILYHSFTTMCMASTLIVCLLLILVDKIIGENLWNVLLLSSYDCSDLLVCWQQNVSFWKKKIPVYDHKIIPFFLIHPESHRF